MTTASHDYPDGFELALHSYFLTEERKEIERHHEDFQKLRDICARADEFIITDKQKVFSTLPVSARVYVKDLLTEIRNVVG